MKFFPRKIILLSAFVIVLFLNFSCNKESDLVVDYIVTDGLPPKASEKTVAKATIGAPGSTRMFIQGNAHDRSLAQDPIRKEKTTELPN